MGKKWLPLESNPDVLNDFSKKLGLDTSQYSFHDVYGLDPVGALSCLSCDAERQQCSITIMECPSQVPTLAASSGTAPHMLQTACRTSWPCCLSLS